jgi:hypothetical protein
VIVGVTLVGPSVGELIHAATIAVVGAVPIDRLWHAVPAYPTISEVWLRLLETLGLQNVCLARDEMTNDQMTENKVRFVIV